MVLLADNEPETFQMYAVLSYNGSVASRGLPYEWQSLVEVYVKAESLVDTWAKNRIIDAMHSFIVQHIPKAILTVEDIRVFGEYFSVAALASLYNGTPVTSQARELVIDLLADNVSAGWVRSKSSLLPQEFLVDLTVRLLNKRSHDLFNNMISRPSSHYHEKTKEDESKVKERPLQKTVATTSKPEARDDLPSSNKQSSMPEMIPHCNFSFAATGVEAA
jgi:hypothetical protein